MKKLRKTLAVALSLSVMSLSASALAATTVALDSANDYITPSYSENAGVGSVGISATGVDANSEMTFVIFNQSNNAITTKITNGTLTGSDIVYLDQATFTSNGSVFSGVINSDRMPDANSDGVIDDGTYGFRTGYYAGGTFYPVLGTLTVAAPVPVVTGAVIDTAGNITALTDFPLTAHVTYEDNNVTGSDTITYSIVNKVPAGNTAAISNGKVVNAQVGSVTVRASVDGTEFYTDKTFTVVNNEDYLTSVTLTPSAAPHYLNANATVTATHVDPSDATVTYEWTATAENQAAVTASFANNVATVTSSVEQTVRVTATATSSTGFQVVEYVDLEFEEEQEENPTVTFRWGDVTLDGYVNGSDALSILNYVAEIFESYPTEATEDFTAGQITVGSNFEMAEGTCRWGDVTLDGYVNGSDALSVLNYVAEIFESYPIEATEDFTAGQFTVGSNAEMIISAE